MNWIGVRMTKLNWQDIISAPQDKTIILICEGNLVCSAWWSGEGNIYYTGETRGIYDNPVEYIPTHWMPLPEPPNGN